ncbi:hypothetical protein BS47DRAFT_1341932 [Hydnum rufescens UP504]|uniref:Uncharacterized protein n=1 Tax=Hydnum rufescens UP504 TaxID=1448309 RepID=A0A9P6DY02_9AGAM|nr:hypothetical protein BS47DRAFT_1341932 [Hydnum rufescens UP504]
MLTDEFLDPGPSHDLRSSAQKTWLHSLMQALFYAISTLRDIMNGVKRRTLRFHFRYSGVDRNVLPCTSEYTPENDTPTRGCLDSSLYTPARPPSPTERTFLLSTPTAESMPYISESSSGSDSSTPSSSASSYTSLRSALRTSQQSDPSPIPISTRSISFSPVPFRKSVRFSETDDMRIFEYGSWEAREKRRNRVLGGWKKNGDTIMWQDDPDTRNLVRPTSPPSSVEEDDIFRRGFYSWLLGGASSRTLASSLSLSAGTTYSPPERGYIPYGEESRWRDGIF